MKKADGFLTNITITENLDTKLKFATTKIEREGKVFMQVEKPEMTFEVSG